MAANANNGRRRWRRAAIGLLVLAAAAAVGTRIVLPSVVRRLFLDRAQALNARIDVGAVELSLWEGGLVLRDVTVRSVVPPRRGADTPLIACRRVVFGWFWTPLVNRTIHLRRVKIEAPRVVLDRLADGDFNLAGLLPTRPKSRAKPNPTPSAAPEWSVAIDRLIVTDAGVRFRDLAIDDAGAVDASLARVEAARIAFTPGRFGQSTRVRLDLAVDDGRLGVVARLALHPAGATVAARLRAQRLPLSRTRVYGPELGWTDLGGRFSANLRYDYVPQREHELRGDVRLDDVAVRVAGVSTEAFVARRVTAVLAPVDFRRERVTLDRVRVSGGRLLVDPKATVPVPLVGGSGAKSKPTPSPTPSRWIVTVQSLTTEDAQLVLPTAPKPTLVDVDLRAHDAVVTGSARVPLRLSLGVGKAAATFDGATRLDGFDLAGDLVLRQVSLPAVIDTFGWLPPNVVQAGTADGTLRLAAGGRSGDLELTGAATVVDAWIAAADPHEFSVGAKRVSGTLQPLRIPGIGHDAVTAPTELHLKDVVLEAPYGEFTRTADGILGPLPDDQVPAAASAPAPPFQLTLDRLRATGGRGYLADRTVTPYFVGGLAPFDADIHHGAWPARTMDYFQVDGRPPERGRLVARGWLVPAGNQLEIETTDVALPPLNPYVVAFTSYSVPRGRLSGSATAWFGPWGWDATSRLVLHDFDLAGGAGDTLFRERLGMSLAVGLAALRDSQGDIELEVPLSVDAAGARVGVSTVMTSAFERALLNLVSTPGKLVRALLPSKSDPQAAFPAPIPFGAGQAAPTAEGDDLVRGLAAFLAARPGLAVTLFGDVTRQDVRRLAEREVRRRLEAGDRMDPPGDRGTVQRIVAALGVRADGGESQLSAADDAMLDRWMSASEATAAARHELATARLDTVRATLRQRFGLDGRRVLVRPPTTAVDEGQPSVLLQFGPVGAVRQE